MERDPGAQFSGYLHNQLLIRALIYRMVTTIAVSQTEPGLAGSDPVVNPRKETLWQPPSTGNPPPPEDQGMSRAGLNALQNGLAEKGTKALLVIRNDHIVHEWYLSDEIAGGHGHYTASMAKALVGGVCLAVAISDGRIAGLDDRAAQYVPRWQDDLKKSKITLRQLGSHTSGMEESKPKDQGGWQQTFWERRDPPEDPFTISRDQTPVFCEPGTQFHYSNPGIAMFGYALTAALKDAPEKDLRTMLCDRIMRPIGAPDDSYRVGYGQTFEVDGLSLVAAWGGGNFTARSAARLGRLMLREGDWDGQRLIDADAVRQTVADAGLPNGNGTGWWTNGRGACETMPRDAFYAAGAEHQTVLVVPSLNLICVRNGASLGDQSAGGDARRPFLFDPLMAAVTD